MHQNTTMNYGWDNEKELASANYITPIIIKIIEKIQLKRIIDIGSGNGALCDVLSNTGLDIVGVENDKKGVEVSKEYFPKIPFYQIDIQDSTESLLRKEEKFDIAISTEVIEHLFSPQCLPEFANNCLNDNGYLIITTPYHGYIKNLLISIFNKWDNHHTPLWHGGHIKFWSRKTLTTLLNQHGFSVKKFYGVGRAPFLWKSMVIVAQKNPA